MTAMDEARLAADIVSVLDPAALRACPSERDVIRYAVRGNSIKLRTIIFDRDALRRLLESGDGVVKIEYLKRDLRRALTHRVIQVGARSKIREGVGLARARLERRVLKAHPDASDFAEARGEHPSVVRNQETAVVARAEIRAR